MSPQFVDFDGDGHIDVVVGTFTGTPSVALGGPDGFGAPQSIRDRTGERIVLNHSWDVAKNTFEVTDRCDPEGERVPDGHATSTFAFDWDGDGDLDLLLGDYAGGRLYLRRNEGDAKNAAFATRNEIVRAGGAPLEVTGSLMTPQAVRRPDGRVDVIVSTGGDTPGDETGGAVYLFRDRAEDGEPDLQGPVVLVPPGPKEGVEPQRPDSALHATLADVDGDGDLDLVVGGYSHWDPPARDLSEADAALARAHQTELRDLRAAERRFRDTVAELRRVAADKEEGRKAAGAYFEEHLAESRSRNRRIFEIETALEKILGPTNKRSFVWLYENLAVERPAAGDPR